MSTGFFLYVACWLTDWFVAPTGTSSVFTVLVLWHVLFFQSCHLPPCKVFHCLTQQNNFIIIFVSLCLYLQYSVSLFFCMSLFCYCLPVCFCIAVSMFSSLSFVTIILFCCHVSPCFVACVASHLPHVPVCFIPICHYFHLCQVFPFLLHCQVSPSSHLRHCPLLPVSFIAWCHHLFLSCFVTFVLLASLSLFPASINFQSCYRLLHP